MEFKVDGDPIPLKRHRTTHLGHRYDPSAKDKAEWIKKTTLPTIPFNDPLIIHLEFVFSRPKKHFRSGRFSKELRSDAPIYHTKTPDLDNLVKFCLDAMNKYFYRDDALVFNLNASKRFCNNEEPPHTKIAIRTLDT